MIAALLLAAATQAATPAGSDDGTIFLCKVYAEGSDEEIRLTFFTPQREGPAEVVRFADPENRFSGVTFDTLKGDLSAEFGKQQFAIHDSKMGGRGWIATLASYPEAKTFKDMEILNILLGKVLDGAYSYTGQCLMMKGAVGGVFESDAAKSREMK